MSTTALKITTYNKNLENCLTKYMKVFKREVSPSRNPVYNSSITKKVSFVKWILKTIKSNEIIPYETLIVMIDTEIIVYKRRLEKSSTKLLADRTHDAIQHLQWLRSLLTSTHRKGFNEILVY